MTLPLWDPWGLLEVIGPIPGTLITLAGVVLLRRRFDLSRNRCNAFIHLSPVLR